jgi:hypothetical protein
MDTGDWLDRWLNSKIVTPRTLEKYSLAVVRLKEAIQFTDLTENTSELVNNSVMASLIEKPYFLRTSQSFLSYEGKIVVKVPICTCG